MKACIFANYQLLWCFTFQFLVCVISASEKSISSSWAKLQMSPDTLCSMPFGNFRVNVYEHSNNHKSTTLANQKRYFYAPIVMLDHKSAISKFNNATKQAEMRFRVEMWNDHVQTKVVYYLPQIVGHEIKSYQVQIISFEQVLLASKKPSTLYTLSTDWNPYQLEKSLWFTLSCFQEKDCNQLKDIMLENPSEFHHLKLLFSLSSQTSQTKESVIRIENIVTGKMVSSLLQKFNPGTDPLLTAEDESRLLSETATNVMVETFDDSDVVSPNSESQIYNMIKDLLVSSRTTISKHDDKMWNSVFWNNDNYRPDKISRKLNEVYKKLDTVNQQKMLDSFSNKAVDLPGTSMKISESYKTIDSQEFNAGLDGFSLGSAVDLSRENSTSKDDLNKLYQESRDHVEWDGQMFVPKPMSLSKMNLGVLRDATQFQDRRVRVRYSTAVLSTPIHFSQLPNVTEEWIEFLPTVTALRSELKELKKNCERELQTVTTNLSIAIASCNLTETSAEGQIDKRTRCVTSPNCYWEGAGPFCNSGNWCPDGFHLRCKDGWGDTNIYCWTGYKALCCRN